MINHNDPKFCEKYVLILLPVFEGYDQLVNWLLGI
jgi:hypothetical protein